MGTFKTDTALWPVVIHTSEGVMGPDETRALIEQLTMILLRKERYVSVFDSSKLGSFRVADRDRIVTWMRENDAAIRTYSIGTGVVLASATLRFVISSVMLVYTPASPIKVFSNLQSATAWARAQVQTDALRIAPARA